MKGLFLYILGVISIILTSCLKESEPQQGKTVLDFSVEQTQTKVAPGSNDGTSISLLWETGDDIHVNGYKSDALVQGGAAKASFTFNGKLDFPYKAVYPASAVVSTESSTSSINLPSTQYSYDGKFDRNAFILIGKSDESDVTLLHTMAYIAFVFEEGGTDAVLSSLEITAAGGEKLCGGFTTDYTSISAKGDASSGITVTCNTAVGSGTAIIAAIPGQNYENGLNLLVRDTEGRIMSKTTEESFNAEAGHYYTTTLTYQPDVDYPDRLYIAGSAVEWDWNLKDSRAVLPEVGNGIYRSDITFNFGENAENGFKFWETDEYGTEYGMTTGSEFGNIGFDLRSNITDAPNGDPQFYLGQKGYQSGEYTVLVDFTTMTVSLTPVAGEPVIPEPLSDKNATEQTKKLYANMMELVETGTMFGAQMPTTQGINYSSSWIAGTNSTDRSDSKDLTGSHPAVCGWEIGHIENGSSNNLDGIPFEKIRAHIIAAYNRGAVNTISWHCNNPVTDGRYNNASDTPVSKILPGGSHHDKFRSWLDKAAEFLLSLKTSDGTLIPIIFRPWHEHTDRAYGSGFWWSVGNNSNDSYKLLWQTTFDYLTNIKGVHNLIWAYSPDLHHLCWNESGLDKYVYMNAWPGDAYVDILGLDAYQTAYSNFDASVANVVNHALSLAEERGKLFAITETGLSNNNPGHYKYFYNEHWWTEKLYPLLSGKRVSYAMVWRNDGYPTDGGFPEYYNAFPGSYSADDFLEFSAKNDILLEDNLPELYK
ncbi:MAG: hypothetical protein IJ005_03870 [Bacteroidales bacterium]|nr:hypothetical protein [Bacteroidales bacterium]